MLLTAKWQHAGNSRRHEARRPTVQMNASGDGRDPLALIPGREPEPGAALEVADELAALMRRGGLTKAQRAKLSAAAG